MYRARKPPHKEYVAIKKLGGVLGSEYTENEVELLKQCASNFIVKLIDVLQQDEVVWVTDLIITHE